MTCREICTVCRYFLHNNLRDITLQKLLAKCVWPLLIFAFISVVCISMWMFKLCEILKYIIMDIDLAY